MEVKDPVAKNSKKNNPMNNFCWPLSDKEKEECIQSYEDVFEEGKREKPKESE